jgi:hypothetical protein
VIEELGGREEHADMPTIEASNSTTKTIKVCVHYCVPEDQKRFLPKRIQVPKHHPAHAPVPRQGEVIYLSSASAWGVDGVIHEWRHNATELHVEVWLMHVSSRHGRPSGFMLTQ